MTIRKRYIISLDDIIAFELQCNKCGIRSRFPIGSKVEISGQCPHCKEPWLILISKALESFKLGIAEIVRHSEDKDVGCALTLEIKGTEDEKAE